MKSFAKVFGAAALAALMVAPAALAREGGHGGGGGGGGGGFSGGSGGHSGGGANFGGGRMGGGGIQSHGARNFGGAPGQPRFSNNFGGGDRGIRGPRRNYSDNWNGNWNGPRNHHRRHRGGLRFYSYGSPYYYDDYYDYGYSSWADDDVSCSYYWRKYQQTGSPRWKARYYNCIS